MSAGLLGNLTSSSDIDFQYPKGIIPCKTYWETNVDCHNRLLSDIPPLEQNLTALLNLSYNLLTEIQGKPFEKLLILRVLDMSNNGISSISSTVFSDLYNLKYLHLENNMLAFLPEDIFVNLKRLHLLDISENMFPVFPPRLKWLTLHSLTVLRFVAPLHDLTSLEIVESFQNMSSLTYFFVGVNTINSNITSKTFKYLTGLPIQASLISWLSKKGYMEHEIDPSLPNVQSLTISYDVLNSFTFTCPQLLSIHILLADEGYFSLLDNSTLKNLAQWNSTLTTLALHSMLTTETAMTIKDFVFTWTPLILVLNLDKMTVQFLTNNAFFGLNFLEQLILSHNYLNGVPSHTFHAFQSQSLRELDLSYNGIFIIGSHAFSSVTSLRHLNLAGNPITLIGNWFNDLSNLISLNMDRTGYTFNVDAKLSSLQILRMEKVYSLIHLPNICNLFPNLKRVTLSASRKVPQPTPSVPLALHNCLLLEYLDLSDSTQSFDFGTITSTLPFLRVFKFAGNQLTSVKEIPIKSNLTYLDLSRNSLKAIGDEDILAFPNLVDLNLESNSLTSIAGLKHLKFLRSLNVANNQLTVISTWVFHKTHLPASSLEKLDLSNNPFHCTCDIEDFREWILSDTAIYLSGVTYTCATPMDLEGQSITAIELDCGSKVGFYISFSIPCALITLALIGLLCKYRWHIKYKLHLLLRNYRPFPNLEEEFEMIEGNGPIQYHAYVAYNDESRRDKDWVLDNLQPNIEDGSEPFQLCIKCRDFVGGRPLIEMISERIYQSRKTILVLTPQFIASEWCYHEMETAQMLLFQQERDVLVLVLLENIPEHKITISLRKLLCKKKYLKWPKDRVGQGLFWQRLREELKTPVHVDRLCDF